MKVKVYHHYAYRMEAAPPFRVCGVSQEIKLVTRQRPDNKKSKDWTHQRIWKDTSQTAYISGLYLDGTTVHMSYGSSDIDARLLSMDVQDLEALFDGSWDCSKSEVIDAGSGEALPPPGGEEITAPISQGSLVLPAQQGSSRGHALAAAGSLPGGFSGLGGWGLSKRTEYIKHSRRRRTHHRDHRN